MTLEAEFGERTPFLRALARRLATDPSIADDLVQETYVATMTGSRRGPQSLVPWLAAVLRNRAARRIRTDSRRRNREQAAAREPTIPDTVRVAIKLEVSRRLLQHVEALDVPGRDAIFLRYYENLKPQQIAERLGVPVDTVKTRLARALARLRERLDADHPDGRQNWLPALGAIGGLGASTKGLVASNAAVAMRAPWLRHVLIAAGVLLTTIVAVTPFLPKAEHPLPARSTTANREASLEQPTTDPQLRREPVAAASPAAMIHGLVEDAGIGAEPSRGRPAANVVVHCRLGLPSEPASSPGQSKRAPARRTIEVETTTDAQGCFQQELPANAVLIAAEVPGNEILRPANWYAPGGSSALTDPPDPNSRIVLTRYPHGLLEGEVTEPSGAAVAGARVVLSTWQDQQRVTIATTASDQNGYFVLQPRNTGSSLAVEREGFVQIAASELRQLPRGGWERAHILLAPSGTLTVDVVDPMGRPTSDALGVAVMLDRPEEGLLEANDCKRGYFRGVVPVLHGRATLAVPAGLRLQLLAGVTEANREQDGQLLPRASGTQGGQPIVVGQGKERVLRLVLGNLQVRVLDPDGQVATDAELSFDAPRNGCLEPTRMAKTDAHGEFALTLGVTDRDQFLMVSARGSGSYAELRAQQWVRLDFATPTSVELRLARAQRLVGNVRDANGRAVAARVRCALTLPGESDTIGGGECETDENGAFSMSSVADAVQRLEVVSDGFATVVRDDVRPGAPIEFVLEQPKRARIRLLTKASSPAIADLVVRVDYLEPHGGVDPTWPALGATTPWSHAALQDPLPPHLASQRIRCPEGTWRFEEYRHVPAIDGPTGRAFELQLDSGPASITVSGSGTDGETLSLVTTGPVTIPGDEVELPLALSPTTTCRGRIQFAEHTAPFAACLALADDTGRLLMLSRLGSGAVWEKTSEASSHGYFSLSYIPIGIWELRVGTRAELERGEARQRRRVVITGDRDEPIVVQL